MLKYGGKIVTQLANCIIISCSTSNLEDLQADSFAKSASADG